MTEQEIEEYKKTAKVGDRMCISGVYGHGWRGGYIEYVRDVTTRGVVTSLKKDCADHLSLLDWDGLLYYRITHKEP